MLGEKSGCLEVVEFNVESENENSRMLMSNVGTIDVAEEVCAMVKMSEREVFYGTENGKIGRINVIDSGEF